MKIAILSITNGPNHDTIIKNHKYHAYRNSFKHLDVQDNSQIFSFWAKFELIIVLNSHCIIYDIHNSIINSFVKDHHKNILLSSIEHIPLAFDAYIIKTTNWSRMFLSDIFRKRIYIDEYIDHNEAKNFTLKQIMINTSLRAFTEKNDCMIHNTIRDPIKIQKNKISLLNKKIGII